MPIPTLNSPSMQLVEDGSPGGLPQQGDPSNELSPTSIVMNFLRSRGGLSGPNVAGNIRTALEQNAREPGFIPGLSNSPVGGGSPSVGKGGGSVAGKVEGRNTPKDASNPADSPVDASNPAILPSERGGTQTTSAAPTSGMNPNNVSGAMPSIAGGSGTGSDVDLSAGQGDASIIPGIVAAILGGGGMAAASRMFGGGKPNPPYTAEGVDPLQRTPYMAEGHDPLQRPAPPPAQPYTAESSDPLQAKPVNLAESSDPLQRSITKAVTDIPIGGPGGVAPANPAMVANAPQGPSTPVINEANIRANLVPPPQVPLRPRPPGFIPVPSSGASLGRTVLQGLASGLRGARVP